MGFSPGVAAPEWCLQAPGRVPLKNEGRLSQGWLWSGFSPQGRLVQWVFPEGDGYHMNDVRWTQGGRRGGGSQLAERV